MHLNLNNCTHNKNIASRSPDAVVKLWLKVVLNNPPVKQQLVINKNILVKAKICFLDKTAQNGSLITK